MMANRKAQPLVFHELLCFCSDMLCVDRCCAGWLVRAEMKICHQLPRRIIGRKLKQPAYKVDHIPVLPAGKAIIVVVRHIQAGVPVVVKGTEGFAVPVYIYPVSLRHFTQAHIVFYSFIYAHVPSVSARDKERVVWIFGSRCRIKNKFPNWELESGKSGPPCDGTSRFLIVTVGSAVHFEPPPSDVTLILKILFVYIGAMWFGPF